MGRIRKRPGLPGGRPARIGEDQWQNTQRELEDRVPKSGIEFGRPVTTAQYPLLSGQHDKTFTNEGATATVEFKLPPPVKGLRFHFFVHASQTLQVTATSKATIRLDTAESALGGNITCATKGGGVTLEVVSPTEWFGRDIVNTWVVT